jgi:hypothetical protein
LLFGKYSVVSVFSKGALTIDQSESNSFFGKFLAPIFFRRSHLVVFGAEIFSPIEARIKRVRERGLPRDRSECEPQRREAKKDQAKKVVWGYMVK